MPLAVDSPDRGGILPGKAKGQIQPKAGNSD